MATTTIPWGDGSGDNIYLTYTSASGNQTVQVSSDPNDGPARTKDITFVSTVGNIARVLTVIQETNMDYVSITWNDTCVTYNDTAIAYPYEEEYIVFADSVVEQICANAWGDGVGLKPSQAAQVTTLGSYFTGSSIETFDELGTYFNNLTTIPNSAFNGCSSLESIILPSSVTSYGSTIFGGCSSLKYLEVNTDIKLENIFSGSFGGSTSKFVLNGNVLASARNNYSIDFYEVVINGDFCPNYSSRYPFNSTTPKVIRISGNVVHQYYLMTPNGAPNFVEVGGTITTGSNISSFIANGGSGIILHLSYNDIAVPFTNVWSGSLSNFRVRCSAVYVGTGDSAAGDQAILDKYLADTNGWAQASDRLFTWYSYNGQYKE